MTPFSINEAHNRYSVEVNYRTTMSEVQDNFAQMLLGYVSAALKLKGLHVKKVFQKEPYRIIISNHNWREGEWVLVVSFDKKEGHFLLSKGFFNKSLDTVSVQHSEKCAGHSAAEVYKTIYNKISGLREEKPHHVELKGVKGKTGPQQGSMRPLQGLLNKIDKFASPSEPVDSQNAIKYLNQKFD